MEKNKFILLRKLLVIFFIRFLNGDDGKESLGIKTELNFDEIHLFLQNHRFWFTKSIYLLCWSVCVSVCLFESNKHQNGWTDPGTNLVWNLTWPHGRSMNDQNSQKFASNEIRFSINFKIHEFFENPQTFLIVFVLQCIQRENVQNWNKRLARSAL